VLAELDEVIGWLAERAADAPVNFLHLLRLAEAERSWAAGDFRAAVLAFDAARREAAGNRRPWHRALIAERAARFLLAHGLDQAGYDMLAAARAGYAAWGATAKVAQLDWAYPALASAAQAASGPGRGQAADRGLLRSPVTTGMIDLLGILSASQALSSETSIERLQARVARVLGAMTGATGVHLLLWSQDRHDWLLPAPGGGTAPLTGSGHETTVPMSVLRYVQRIGEPLVVGDATRDDRFARDPYFARVDCCALLALPVLSRGVLQAVLLLENRLLRGAFSTERLDAVQLIAGQLAVSLDNAQLYAELSASRTRIVATADATRRRIERDLHDGAQQRLVTLTLKLRAARAALPADAGEAARRVDEVADGLAGALEELREIARGLHPGLLAHGGLRLALQELARRSAVPVRLNVQVPGRLPDPVEIAAYYAVSEALTNAIKHARATVTDIEVTACDGFLHVRVCDDGHGGAVLGAGSGLIGLADRIEAAGGRLELHSPPGDGTTIRITLPLADPGRPSPPAALFARCGLTSPPGRAAD
jgi:signal transduction histidine kinase